MTQSASEGLDAGGISLSVENSTFSDNADDGVSIGSSVSGAIMGCTFSGNTNYGVASWGGSPAVSGCTFHGGILGIYMSGCQSPTLTGNTFSNNTVFAALINNPTGTVTLSGNTSTGSPVNGLAVRGTMSADSRLTADSGFPYVISGDLTVNPGKTLTVDPGAVIKLASGNTLTVFGTLSALGTAPDPVYFTSIKDDTAGGDTNGDGSASSPAKGDWARIGILGSGAFENCVVRYGGGAYASLWGPGSSATLRQCTVTQSAGNGVELNSVSATDCTFSDNAGRGASVGGSADILNCTFSNNQGGGVSGGASLTASGCTFSGNGSTGASLGSTDATVTNCTFSNNRDVGVSGNGASLTASGCTFSGNQGDAIQLWYSKPPTLTNNSFSNNRDSAVNIVNLTTGGTVALSGNSAAGNRTNGVRIQSVSADVRLTADAGLPYAMGPGQTTDFGLTNGKTLTIDPGAVFKGVNLFVAGTVRALGTAANPIYFTSIKDDSVCGDTNGDGGASIPHRGDWSGIVIQNAASSGVLEHCVVRYGSAVQCIGGSLTTHHCTITQSGNDDIIVSSSGAVTANSCILAYANGYGIRNSGGTVDAQYCDFWANGSGHVSGAVSMTGEMYADPSFVDLANGDYRLAPNSPCIDSGDPGETDLDGSQSDRGALLPWPCVSFTKTRADNTLVAVVHATVAAGTDVMGSFAYIEDWDRTAGIRVINGSLPTGQSVELTGTIRTTNGEREIVADQVRLLGSRPVPSALGMSNRWVGGGNWRYDSSTGAGQQGLTGGYGMNNIGLLIGTWGIVTEVEAGPAPTWFKLSDGSFGGALRVKMPGGIPSGASVGARVGVRGISSTEQVAGDLTSLILPTAPADVVVY